ncbi:spermidine synthase [Legionella sp. WA2022007384]
MWKTKLGRCIYTSPSGYKVYQNGCYRWLTLGSNALQTVINRHKPHKPVLYYLPALTIMARNDPGVTCLLGLGGAGVALMLKDAPIIAVDNSEEVIEIAKRFFMIDRLKNLTVIHENAVDYVQKCEINFTHLIVDLYNANHFPPECANTQFFASCKRIITENGILAVNLANIKEQYPIFQLIKNQFNHTLVVPIRKSANMVILAAKNESKELFMEKIKETGAFKRIIWVDSWGYVGDYKQTSWLQLTNYLRYYSVL